MAQLTTLGSKPESQTGNGVQHGGLADLSRLSVAEKHIVILSFYRDGELRGARLLFNLLGHLEDADSQVKMSRHLADETRHAYLWTKRIAELGAAPVAIGDGYQRRLGKRVGVPKDLIDLFALTTVVEESAQRRYLSHLARPSVDPKTIEVLKAVTEDETWHIAWIEKKMHELAAAQGKQQRAVDALARYREIDREVWASMEQFEEDLYRI